MKIRIWGGGWYGCHIALTLLDCGHDVHVHEIAPRLFNGASGANPARLHIGWHYPRSLETRRLSQLNYHRFMKTYGHLTRGIPVNIYAVAKGDSLVDFGNYIKVLGDEVPFVPIERPSELGLQNVEGAVLTGERHILVNKARDFFTENLDGRVVFNTEPGVLDDPAWDLTIDCTFCSMGREGVDRYEPCVTYLMKGDYDKAVTIMDGPFPSIYPHYEPGIVSLTSAKYTPLARCKTSEEARAVLEDASHDMLLSRFEECRASMAKFYPRAMEYELTGWCTAVRAMPLSGADSRIYGIVKGDRSIKVRAGKIDAIFSVADEIVALCAA